MTTTAAASTADFTSSISSSSYHKLPLEGMKPDLFVVAAPIIIAAVCKDGVAIIAAHPPLTGKDNNDDTFDEATAIQMDPLLYYRPKSKHNNNNNDNNQQSDQNDIEETHNKSDESKITIDVLTEEDDGMIPFVDIPKDFGGPYRITSIGRISTDGIVVISCGWRPDCQTILDYCETVLDNEIQSHGRQQRISLHAPYNNDYLFPNRLASQLSYYMAQCAVSERVRTLSSVSLVISAATRNNGDGKSSGSGGGGCIWLVDASGAYPVHAHCIGGGIVPPEIIAVSEDERNKLISTKQRESKISNTVSEFINRRLVKEYYTSTSTTTKYGLEDCTVEEGLKRLVLLLANKDIVDNENNDNNDDKEKRMMHPPTIPLLRRNTQLELAVLKLQQQQTQQHPTQKYPVLLRKTLKGLFGNRLSR